MIPQYTNMHKDFDKWNGIKKDIDRSSHKPPLFKERDIWWCAFGVNVGSEVCGKNSYSRRPVIVIKKLSHESFIGAPLSTKENTGSWYISVSHSGGIRNTINLAQIRYFDFRRLDKKIGSLDTEEFKRLQNQLKKILGL